MRGMFIPDILKTMQELGIKIIEELEGRYSKWNWVSKPRRTERWCKPREVGCLFKHSKTMQESGYIDISFPY